MFVFRKYKNNGFIFIEPSFFHFLKVIFMSCESSVSQILCVTFTIIYLIFSITPLVIGIVFLSTETPFERRSKIREYKCYIIIINI